MSFQKFTLPTNAELPQAVVDRLEQLPKINVYRMIANAPQCLIPWTDMVKALYQSKVSIRLREIAILRQAAIARSPYELHQHRFIAKANGISDTEIDLICTATEVTELSELENTVCAFAEEMERGATASQRTLATLQQHLSQQEVAELIVLTSFYCCVARVLNATKVEIEASNPLQNAASPN